MPQWVGNVSKELEEAIERAQARERSYCWPERLWTRRMAERSPGGGAATLCIENCGAAHPSRSTVQPGWRSTVEVSVNDVLSASFPPSGHMPETAAI